MKIGILGGIGPFSSAYFYNELVKRIADKPEVVHNNQFPQIIINSIPSPELEDILFDEAEKQALLNALVKGVKELTLLKPDFIVMICNTVHLYLDYIKKKSGFDAILNLPKIIQNKLNAIVGRQENLCVLGSLQTVEEGLYKFSNYDYCDPSSQELSQINEIIHGYTSSGDFDKYSEQLRSIIRKKQIEGANLFILSCTEISLLTKGMKIKSIDTLECLLEHVVVKFMTQLAGFESIALPSLL